MSSSVPRISLTLKDKVRVLKTESKHTYSRIELAKMFGVGKSQIYRLIQDRDRIMRLYNKNRINDEYRRLDHLRGNNLVLDKSLLDWLKRLRDRHTHVTGPMMKKTALRMAEFLGMHSFKASNGWLQGFNKRYKLSLAKNRYKATGLMDKWKSKIVDLINEYDAQDIYAVDETGLFLWALPIQNSDLENMTCSAGEMPRDRATVLLCANMKGEKEKPLVMSSIFNDFEGMGELPSGIEWQYEEKSFVTEEIMTDWLKRFDRKIGRQGRKIVLFLDHARSHQLVKLDNITLLFVHPNFTPTCDAMEQGIVQNFKRMYRKRLLQYSIDDAIANELIDQGNRQLDGCQVLQWISDAWDRITPNTIINAFNKAGFPVKPNFPCTESSTDDEDRTDYVQFCGIMGIIPDDELKSYYLIDNNLTVEAVSDDVIELVKYHLHLSSTSSKMNEANESAKAAAEARKASGIMSATEFKENQNDEGPPDVSSDQFDEVMEAEECRQDLEEFLIFK